jgi:hypothetical protein
MKILINTQVQQSLSAGFHNIAIKKEDNTLISKIRSSLAKAPKEYFLDSIHIPQKWLSWKDNGLNHFKLLSDSSSISGIDDSTTQGRIKVNSIVKNMNTALKFMADEFKKFGCIVSPVKGDSADREYRSSTGFRAIHKDTGMTIVMYWLKDTASSFEGWSFTITKTANI